MTPRHWIICCQCFETKKWPHLQGLTCPWRNVPYLVHLVEVMYIYIYLRTTARSSSRRTRFLKFWFWLKEEVWRCPVGFCHRCSRLHLETSWIFSGLHSFGTLATFRKLPVMVRVGNGRKYRLVVWGWFTLHVEPLTAWRLKPSGMSRRVVWSTGDFISTAVRT